MNRQKRTPGLGDAPVTTASGGARDRLRDAGSKELALLAKKVGNAEVGALIGASQEKRDALLAFIERRLSQIQAVQQAEQKEMVDRRDWWMRVGRGVSGFELLDPTRWQRAARLYRRAAEAVCAGDLGRGAHLLDQAVRAERATFDTVPTQIELPSALKAPAAGPEERPFVDEGESAPPTQAPGLFRIADSVLRVSETMDELPVPKDQKLHHWWDVAEDEEAKDKDAKKGAKDGGKAPDAGAAERRAAEEARLGKEIENAEKRATSERHAEVERRAESARVSGPAGAPRGEGPSPTGTGGLGPDENPRGSSAGPATREKSTRAVDAPGVDEGPAPAKPKKGKKA